MSHATPLLSRLGRHFPAILNRLGLHRRELRAWAMYDWANSAMVTVIITAVFPIFFSGFAAAELPSPEQRTQVFGLITTIGLVVIAVLAPILGTIADFIAIKKRLMGTFLGVGVAAVACMFFIGRGDLLLASVLFILANIAANGTFVFYESLLPHVARPDEVDRVSTAGYALGYVGGGLLLLLNLAWILSPATFGLPDDDSQFPARLAFLSVAVWWALFSIPIFRTVPEPPVALEPDEHRGQNPLAVAFRRLRETFGELRGSYRQAFLMLVAFLIYNDGIGTIIRMATVYGTEIGIGQTELITAIVLVQFVGIPFAFAFGALAGKLGAKRSIFLGLAVYVGICVVGFFMRTATHFFLLATLVGMVQGGTQALSRSLFATLIPRHKSGEFFGFFGVFEKFAGIFGPLVFTVMVGVSGSSRNSILALIVFFVVGGWLLLKVDVEAGQRIARAAEEEAGTAPAA